MTTISVLNSVKKTPWEVLVVGGFSDLRGLGVVGGLLPGAAAGGGGGLGALGGLVAGSFGGLRRKSG